jgi:hypothetical protein
MSKSQTFSSSANAFYNGENVKEIVDASVISAKLQHSQTVFILFHHVPCKYLTGDHHIHHNWFQKLLHYSFNSIPVTLANRDL